MAARQRDCVRPSWPWANSLIGRHGMALVADPSVRMLARMAVTLVPVQRVVTVSRMTQMAIFVNLWRVVKSALVECMAVVTFVV